jgi:hypothetical protein
MPPRFSENDAKGTLEFSYLLMNERSLATAKLFLTCLLGVAICLSAASLTDAQTQPAEQEVTLPRVVQSVPGESEADGLDKIVNLLKQNEFRLSSSSPTEYCSRFMDSLLSTHQVRAVEPIFVTESDEEVTEKLNLKHCAAMQHPTIIPPDVNPSLYLRGSYGFNFVADLGGPPYRLYEVRMGKKRRKHIILYYNSREGWGGYTGFARLDLKKCLIITEISGHSEVPNPYEVGRNILVSYNRQLFVILLSYNPDGPVFELRSERLNRHYDPNACSWTYCASP